jgi:hypothetical protein
MFLLQELLRIKVRSVRFHPGPRCRLFFRAQRRCVREGSKRSNRRTAWELLCWWPGRLGWEIPLQDTSISILHDKTWKRRISYNARVSSHIRCILLAIRFQYLARLLHKYPAGAGNRFRYQPCIVDIGGRSMIARQLQLWIPL